jgi:D-glycerate 3-kinase
MTSSIDLEPALADFIAREGLPASYRDTVERWFLPLAEQVLGKVAHSRRTLIVGVSGCQGSGKSTLAELLVLMLKQLMGLRCINLSIDDFYLTHARRQELGAVVHPLLATRGVPGTHDVDLALSTLNALREGGEVRIPRFNKGVDDRAPQSEWPRILAPVDVIVLEGWCLSIGPEDEAALEQPINELEANEDIEGHWRRYVNAQLQGPYAEFYAMVDFLVFLKAPDFAKVYEWRQRQEDKLAARVTGEAAKRVMNPAQLKRFIQHYERLTRHGLATLAERADVVFELTAQQTIATCGKR